MEKIGVEVVKPEDQELNKLAAQARPECSHPSDRVYTSKGISFCRKCEKYLSISND